MRSVTIDGPVTFDGSTLTLSDDQVADLRKQLGVESSIRIDDGLIDTAAAAKLIGMSEDYVREHALELGGFKHTDSPRARWHFDPTKLTQPSSPKEAPVMTAQPRRRAPRRAGSGQLLQSKG